MDPTLGTRLRAHREQRQISLAAVCADTKIKLFMLEAFENDDVSQWPEGIYRRAYVRAYARAVGLDPEVLVREFLDAHPDPVIGRPPEEIELENPAWPAEIRRFLNSARGAVPARRGDVSQTGVNSPAPEPTHPPQEPSASDAHTRQPLEPNLVQAAALCTRLLGALHQDVIADILEDAATAVGAAGLVVWSWNSRKGALMPWLAYGYTEELLATMGCIPPDADNAIAVALRSMEPCVIARDENPTGAMAVPIMSLGECLGVLALELADGDEESDSVRAFATILAAHFVPHLSASPLAAAVNA